MKTINYDTIGEQVYYEKLDNGLDVFLIEKPEYNKTYATFTTKYGSIDNTFTPLGNTELTSVPDGIAHFLEHKLFESEEGDVFLDFAENGASANAYTSFTRTAYLFSATDKVKTNLETLLNFVQDPYFTEENVEKEKGIIAQEIKMYDDDPSWRLYFGAIANIFHNHPVKIDIAGTVESISEITKDDLYLCYDTFYHPSNMILVVIGSFESKEMIELIRDNQQSKQFEEASPIKRFFEDEPNSVAIKEKTIKMDISKPKSLVGIKLKTNSETKFDIKRELSISLALDILFSKSGNYYQEMIDLGLINESFSFEYNEENGYGFSVIGGDTDKPTEMTEYIIDKISDVSINDESFTRIKKRTLGTFIKSLNSLEYIANQYTGYYLKGYNLFEVKDYLMNLTKEEFDGYISDFFDVEMTTTFTIQPEN